jgi:uncharacterized membrane protein YgcG
MRISLNLSLALLIMMSLPIGARADAPGVSFLPEVGMAGIHLHIEQTIQASDGRHTRLAELDVRRRDAEALIFERKAPNGKPDPVLVVLSDDGQLRLKDDKLATSAAADVAALLPALSLAMASARGASPASTWYAHAALPGLDERHSIPIDLPVKAAQPGVDGFDFFASTSTTSSPATPGDADTPGEGNDGNDQPRRRSGPGGFGGFGGVGGFGGFGGSGGASGSAGQRTQARPARQASLPPVTVALQIDGHVSNGVLRRFSLTVTRTLTFNGTPYVNAGTTRIERIF